MSRGGPRSRQLAHRLRSGACSPGEDLGARSQRLLRWSGVLLHGRQLRDGLLARPDIPVLGPGGQQDPDRGDRRDRRDDGQPRQDVRRLAQRQAGPAKALDAVRLQPVNRQPPASGAGRGMGHGPRGPVRRPLRERGADRPPGRDRGRLDRQAGTGTLFRIPPGDGPVRRGGGTGRCLRRALGEAGGLSHGLLDLDHTRGLLRGRHRPLHPRAQTPKG